MSQPPSAPLKTTPFAELHRRLGARMVPFAGWNMPIQFAGVIEEHRCVREHAGLFDVSHMGEIEIRGKDAGSLLQRLVTNDVESLEDGAILYTVMCYENGGVVDDLLVHRFREDHYFLCVNAANTDKDFDWIQNTARDFQAETENISDRIAQLAVQGPQSVALLQTLSSLPLDGVRYYHFEKGKIHNYDCMISRTGYTGEDGFELYTDADGAQGLAEAILQAGKPFGIQPVGLGARDTLRLEMGYALYGNDITAETTPLEAGLGWVVKLKKGPFTGHAALVQQKQEGIEKKLVGFKLLERGVPRPHYKVLKDGKLVGEVTSGTFSPSLNVGIGLCYVSKEHSEVGSRLDIEIRNQRTPAEIVKPPFVPSRVKK